MVKYLIHRPRNSSTPMSTTKLYNQLVFSPSSPGGLAIDIDRWFALKTRLPCSLNFFFYWHFFFLGFFGLKIVYYISVFELEKCWKVIRNKYLIRRIKEIGGRKKKMYLPMFWQAKKYLWILVIGSKLLYHLSSQKKKKKKLFQSYPFSLSIFCLFGGIKVFLGQWRK